MTPLSNDPRFPIGKLAFDRDITQEKRRGWIDAIRHTPAQFRAAATGLTDAQLDTPYRDGGWTARQVIHHMPESHANAWIRFKLALTEDSPTIKPYDEAAWARLADTALTPPDVSLALLDALHSRWVALLNSMTAEDFARPLQHPEHGKLTLDWMLQQYAWHGRHHAGHVSELRKREGW